MKWFIAIGVIGFMSTILIYTIVSNDDQLSSQTVKFHDEISIDLDHSEVKKVFLKNREILHPPSTRAKALLPLNSSYVIKENTNNQVDMISIETINIDPLLQIEGVKPVAMLTIGKDEIATLVVGSTLTIPAESFLYEMEIKGVSHFQDRSKIYHLLLADEEGFGGIMIQKGNTLLLTFDTPNGTYEGMLYQGKGVIYRSDEIEYQLNDTTIKDTL